MGYAMKLKLVVVIAVSARQVLNTGYHALPLSSTEMPVTTLCA